MLIFAVSNQLLVIFNSYFELNNYIKRRLMQRKGEIIILVLLNQLFVFSNLYFQYDDIKKRRRKSKRERENK